MLFYCFAEKVFEPFTLQYAKLLNFSKYPRVFSIIHTKFNGD